MEMLAKHCTRRCFKDLWLYLGDLLGYCYILNVRLGESVLLYELKLSTRMISACDLAVTLPLLQ